MSDQLKFSEQETIVKNYLIDNYIKSRSIIFWEELAQFAKDPQNVKIKTMKKVVSEIKRKYKSAGLEPPFEINFRTMTDSVLEKKESKLSTDINAMEMFSSKSVVGIQSEQVLVKMKRTPTLVPKVMVASLIKEPVVNPMLAPVAPIPMAHLDFVLDRNMKRVRTKSGYYNLNDGEWEVFKYFHANVGKLIPISEIRDKVVFPQYGSKLPARWFDAIMRLVNNARKQIPELQRRLLTVKGSETNYLFQ